MTEKAVRVLDYIKDLELKNGGIRSWKGGSAYPEVTGYLIPTLLDYGEKEMAVRCADWLVKIQGKDGSFRSMDNIKHTFDTSACMEGLMRSKGNYEYNVAVDKAHNWILKYVRDDGAIRKYPQTKETHLYTMRASWLIDSRAGAEYWLQTEWEPTRDHYVAYALEGLWEMGHEDFVTDKILSRSWISEDLCANAQFAILKTKANLDPRAFVDAVNDTVGAIVNAWEAKWILDMWKVIGD